MESQRVGEDDPEPDSIVDGSVHKADVQRAMVSIATQSKGFILWLDFVRSSAAETEALLRRPLLLPKLDGIQVIDVNYDQLPENDVNQRAPVAKKLESHARTIAAVARKALHEASTNVGILEVASEYDTRPIHEITNFFSEMRLSYREYQWFQQHSTGDLVIDSIRRLQADMRAQ
jgi:hypothetical protein